MHVHVHAGHDTLVKSLFQVLGSGVEIVYVFYVHPVAHHKALEAPFTASDFLHQPFIRMARYPVQFVVRCHQGHRPCIHSRLERREKHFPYRPFRQVGRGAVSPVYRLAAAYEMLDAGQDIVRRKVTLIASHCSHSHLRHQIRILSECLADPAPARIPGHFDIRIEGPVHVHRTHLRSRLSRYPVRQICVE